MKLTPATKAKLEQSKRMLEAEFNTVPHDQIEREIEAIATALVEEAHFDDYIPILAQRSVRDRLRYHQGDPLPGAA